MAKKDKVKLSKLEKWFRTLCRLDKIIYRPLFPYKKYVKAPLSSERPYIFVGNHLSLLDVVYIGTATGKPVHFLAKKDLFKKGFMKWFTAKCECIPVTRDGTDVKAVMQSMKYLKNGESVAIYPEGTRNRTEEIMLPFKRGAAAISIKTKTPIVPVVHLNRIKIFKKEYVLLGEPIEFSDYYDKKLTDEVVSACDASLRNKMLEMYAELAESVTKKKKR